MSKSPYDALVRFQIRICKPKSVGFYPEKSRTRQGRLFSRDITGSRINEIENGPSSYRKKQLFSVGFDKVMVSVYKNSDHGWSDRLLVDDLVWVHVDFFHEWWKSDFFFELGRNHQPISDQMNGNMNGPFPGSFMPHKLCVSLLLDPGTWRSSKISD